MVACRKRGHQRLRETRRTGNPGCSREKAIAGRAGHGIVRHAARAAGRARGSPTPETRRPTTASPVRARLRQPTAVRAGLGPGVGPRKTWLIGAVLTAMLLWS